MTRPDSASEKRSGSEALPRVPTHAQGVEEDWQPVGGQDVRVEERCARRVDVRRDIDAGARGCGGAGSDGEDDDGEDAAHFPT